MGTQPKGSARQQNLLFAVLGQNDCTQGKQEAFLICTFLICTRHDISAFVR
jgi:hypothetical protein